MNCENEEMGESQKEPEKEAGKAVMAGLGWKDLETLFRNLGEPRFRAVQAAEWIYKKRVDSIQDMANLPRPLREKLGEEYTLFSTRLEETVKAQDKTRKVLIRLRDHACIEGVVIHDGQRETLCLSSQAGCPVRCRFCASGRKGLLRNLTASEMVEEFMHLSRIAVGKVTHLVFMGMGEPLLNTGEVFKALNIITAPWGMNFGSRRITLSTVGIEEGIEELIRQGIQLTLALSLHAPDDEIRSSLIPYSRKGSVENLLKLAGEYRKATGRDVTVEYVLLDKVNSSVKHAQVLAGLLRKKRINVNLIPFNPVDGLDFQAPPRGGIESFLKILRQNGIVATLRKSRGLDAGAACGQLVLR